MRGLVIASVFAACLAAPAKGAAQEGTIGEDRRDALGATLYSNGLALIRDRRSVDVVAGRQSLAIADVSPNMVPSSVLLSAAGLRVVSVDYDFDVMAPTSILRRHLGREVGVVRTHPTTGEESVERATVLSVASGVVLRYRDRIETGIPGRLVFDAVPDDLRVEPTLEAVIEADNAGGRPLEIVYLTSGLSWAADYVVVINDEAKSLNLEGRANVSNTAGFDLVDADVVLAAGDVRRVTPGQPIARMAAMAAPMAAEAMRDSPLPERQRFSDIHIYRLGEPVTVREQQSRQFTLLRAEGVPFTRHYISMDTSFSPYLQPVAGERSTHPEVEYRFALKRSAAAATPMPAGLVRLYGRDANGTLRLLGEDQIGHTAAGEEVELTPGTAFDITVDREQTDLVRTGLGDKVSESAHRITVRNARTDEPVSVAVIERIPGDWVMLEESAAHEKAQADRAEWIVEVPAGGEVEVTYRVRVTR